MPPKNLKHSLAVQIIACTMILVSCQKAVILPKQQTTLHPNGIGTQPLSSFVPAATPSYQPIWTDGFNTSGAFDTTKWEYSSRGTSAWDGYLTSLPQYANLNGSNLLLRMDNAVIPGNSDPYHTSGLDGLGKFAFTYGRVEARIKFNESQGSWPAFWMIPAQNVYGTWPNSGEVDIAEHFNSDGTVGQNLYGKSLSVKNNATYTQNDYNIYALEWTPTSMKFYINNVLTYTYNRVVGATWQQWPFNEPFYIILDQAGGAGSASTVNTANLPFTTMIDYVNVYKLSLITNGDFESSSFSGWWAWGTAGTTSLVNSNANTGTHAVKETGGECSLEQTITGLTPNTTYIFGGFGKVSAAGQYVILGVKDFGNGPEIDSTFTGNLTYKYTTVKFTTGPSTTSATIYFYKPATGTAYGDSFYLEQQM